MRQQAGASRKWTKLRMIRHRFRQVSAACAAVLCLIGGMLPASAKEADGSAAAAPILVVERPFPLPRASHLTACVRARALADRFGETFAAQRLRETLVARSCALHGDDRHNRVSWDWPWRSLTDPGSGPGIAKSPERELLLPPNALHTVGDWQIRCDRAATAGRRCAITRIERDTSAEMTDTPDPKPTAALVAHAVLNSISGRQTLVFRIFVPRRGADPLRLAIRHSRGSSIVPVLRCGQTGCLAEADAEVAAAIVHDLWDGAAIDIIPSDRAGEPAIKLKAGGFREGVRGLVDIESAPLKIRSN